MSSTSLRASPARPAARYASTACGASPPAHTHKPMRGSRAIPRSAYAQTAPTSPRFSSMVTMPAPAAFATAMMAELGWDMRVAWQQDSARSQSPRVLASQSRTSCSSLVTGSRLASVWAIRSARSRSPSHAPASQSSRIRLDWTAPITYAAPVCVARLSPVCRRSRASTSSPIHEQASARLQCPRASSRICSTPPAPAVVPAGRRAAGRRDRRREPGAHGAGQHRGHGPGRKRAERVSDPAEPGAGAGDRGAAPVGQGRDRHLAQHSFATLVQRADGQLDVGTPTVPLPGLTNQHQAEPAASRTSSRPSQSWTSPRAAPDNRGPQSSRSICAITSSWCRPGRAY